MREWVRLLLAALRQICVARPVIISIRKWEPLFLLQRRLRAGGISRLYLLLGSRVEGRGFLPDVAAFR